MELKIQKTDAAVLLLEILQHLPVLSCKISTTIFSNAAISLKPYYFHSLLHFNVLLLLTQDTQPFPCSSSQSPPHWGVRISPVSV